MSSQPSQPPRTMASRPKLCPCRRTCTPIWNSMAIDDRIKDEEADMSQGYSGECIGQMDKSVKFVYGDSEHTNDVNHCFFTPLKGIIRFQENSEDLASAIWLLSRALDVLEPMRCSHCGENNRLCVKFHHLIDPEWIKSHPNASTDEWNNAPRKTYCDLCGVHLGILKPYPDNFGKGGLAKYFQR